MIILNYVTSVLLIALGLYTVCTKKNLIKIVLGLGIIDYGINLLIVSIGYTPDATAPIYTMSDLLNGVAATSFVDPVPQALTLTSIVIGACVDAMALALVIKINRHYGSINADEVRRLKG
ncbi:MAG: NADH-quinone oxidoreductase subunit K [Lachnospiraceae bacterium]|nr:NADH-quinone oxidoreductase subunit K [Candidatus Minthocola equi]